MLTIGRSLFNAMVCLLTVVILTSGTFNNKAWAAGNNWHSEAFVVMDANSGTVIHSKNMTKEMYPASITKIVTAIIAIESVDVTEKTTISEKAIHADGTRVYLLEDEEVTIEQLLHGLMVSSGNDAGIAIAEHISGSVEEFSEEMNRFLQEEIGVDDTYFTNPHGLFEEDHVTTALDMAKISAYAMKNEEFRELVSTESYEWVGEGWETTLFNHHPLLRERDEVIGVKNGFVTKSGYTLVTAAVEDDTELIVVTLNGPSRDFANEDTLALLEKAFSRYETAWVSFEQEEELADYIYPDELPITVTKGEEVRHAVSENGYVSIFGEDNRLLNIEKLGERRTVELPVNLDLDKGLMGSVEADKSIMEWLLVTGFLYFPSEK